MRSDSITIQAQTLRSRTANTDENQRKLVEELHRIYRERVPAATSEKKIKKHEEMYAFMFLKPCGVLVIVIVRLTLFYPTEKKLSTIIDSV
jgi:hypothetical protein